MLAIVGLGNPGSEYEGTRHNIGFDVAARLAGELGVRFRNHRLYRSAAGRAHGEDILLVTPGTYMNNSGEAVRELLWKYGLAPGDLIVCCDDLHLPLGTVRLRKKGSDGGHNGLRSVIREIGSAEFPRLRCGIRGESAPGPGEATAEYVLGEFDAGERREAQEMAALAAEAVLLAARNGIDRAMNIVNAK